MFRNPVSQMSDRITRMAIKASAVQLALMEDELLTSLDAEIERLESEGRTDLAARLRTIAKSDMAALEGPKRGRPAKKLDGE